MILSGSVQAIRSRLVMSQSFYCVVKYKRVVPSLGAMDLIEELMSADSEHLPTYVCPTVFHVLRDI